MKQLFTVVIATVLCLPLFGQTQARTADTSLTRQLIIHALEAPVKIDGSLSEPVWQTAPSATGFTEYSPQPNAPEQEAYASHVWVFYDQTALYIGAYLTDTPDVMTKEFTKRDDSGNSDYFSVLIDTYCDRINGYEFSVTAAGQQIDKRHSPTSSTNSYAEGDATWDAVWHSAVKDTDEGWYVEIKIPFSAIRFSKADLQVWGFNLMRYRRQTRQELYWNPRRPEITDRVAQWGTATGVNHVDPPTLLSFSPYIAAYTEHYPQRNKPWDNGFSAGLDLKWGISRAFTLDAVLIPDFGEVKSDALVHNVTPFEVEYNENRPFFMEGTELFNKGNYFYSRRIGGAPVFHDQAAAALRPNEEVTLNPVASKLINAVKFSGRTQNGLGIGVLNAITSPMDAVVNDTLTGAQRLIETAPLTNYNVFVLDKSLKNNSYVSFVNTSVLRAGAAYESDVMGVLFRLNDARNNYYVQGQGTGSFFTHKAEGYKYNVEVGKARGQWQYSLTHELMDQHIDINDLGIQHENNRVSVEGELKYRIYEPTRWYNSMNYTLEAELNQRFRPYGYEKANISLDGSVMLKDYTMINLGVSYQPASNDFYEAQKEGRYIALPGGWSSSFMFSSNYAKPFYCDVRFSHQSINLFDFTAYTLSVQPAFRFSPRFLVSLNGALNYTKDDIGSAWRNASDAFSAQDSVFIARRDLKQIEVVLDAKYAFSALMNITLTARHYLSKVQNKQSYFLRSDGQLLTSNFDAGSGMVYSLFYIDLIYTWRFAPGSELNVVWKNQISPDIGGYQARPWLRDVAHTFSFPQHNNLSVKLIYYLDWQTFRKTKRTTS